jgi:hypothetical protein
LPQHSVHKVSKYLKLAKPVLFDAGRLGHPFTFKNEQNTKSVQATVLENCRVTTMETAENCALVLVQHM